MKGDLVLVLPLTSKYNEKLEEIYFTLDGRAYNLASESYVLLNQIKVISKKRLIRKIQKQNKDVFLDNAEFLQILEKVKSYI